MRKINFLTKRNNDAQAYKTAPTNHALSGLVDKTNKTKLR